jgi:predicted nucleotidyltransferase
MEDPKVREQFEKALELFVERVKQDTQVLGVILFGSMAKNYVHDRSNINVMVITKEGRDGYKRLLENGVQIDAGVYGLDEFRRRINGRQRVAYHQSLCQSKLLFSRDGALTDIFNSISKKISGQDQSEFRLMYSNYSIYDLRKAEKYLYIKNDLEHSLWYTVHALSELGYCMCYMNGIFPPRETILEAKRLYPDFFTPLYDNLVNSKLTKELLEETIRKTYEFLDEHALENNKLILDYISKNNGSVSQSDILAHFRPTGGGFAEFDYLHRRRILRRTYTTKRLTKKGRVEYNEPLYHFNWDTFDSNDMVPTQVGPSNVDHSLVVKDYQVAFDSLVEKAKEDEYVLSVMICGSLFYDKVWEKSDLDVIIITRDEPFNAYQSLLERDVYIDAFVHTRDGFRKRIQRATDGSILHSFFSKSKVVFTRDDSIYDLYEDLEKIGLRDLEKMLMTNYVYAKDLINKALRAINLTDDPSFSFNFILSGIRRLASIEVILNRQIPLRESIEQALKINPVFFKDIFIDTVRISNKNKETMMQVINKMDQYLKDRLEIIIQPVLRLIKKHNELSYEDLWEHFRDIRITIDLKDFIDADLITEIPATCRFVKKSSSEMLQPAYIIESTSDDDTLMMDIEI